MSDFFKRMMPMVLLPLLSGCYQFFDPSDIEIAPALSSEPWVPYSKPLYSISYPTCSSSYLYPKNLEERGELGLSSLIDIALNNNPKTQESWALARAAAYGWYASKSAYYPTITGSETLILQKSKSGQSVAALDDINGVASSGGASRGFFYDQFLIQELVLSYLLFDFGGRDANYEATRQMLISANWMHNQVLQNVILQVMQSYYAYLQTLGLLEAKREQIKDAQASSDAAESQYEVGVVTKVDFLLAKTNLINVQLQLTQLEGDLQINRGQIAAALGYSASTKLNLAGLPKEINLQDVEVSVEELVQLAMEERPDLAAAYANYFANEQEIIIARSLGLPTLNFLSDAQKVNEIHHPRNNSERYRAGISLDIPIFAGFLYVNNTRQAEERAAAARAVVEDLQTSISFQVVSAYYNLKIAIETVKSAKESLAFAKEAYNAAALNYQYGIGSILDLLTAQTALANARAQLVNANTGWVTSLANLAHAVGTLKGNG